MVAVTGLGSLPGTDFVAAARRVFEDCPELPYVPELPARGPWATMIGRSAGLLSGLAVSLEAGQWRLSATPGWITAGPERRYATTASGSPRSPRGSPAGCG
ncbi:MAG: hypothetical protein HZY73_09150 [Micropruina sp.]|nr:MAG: hypothetical protein HZY73_09150 [Micropruina sp.]